MKRSEQPTFTTLQLNNFTTSQLTYLPNIPSTTFCVSG